MKKIKPRELIATIAIQNNNEWHKMYSFIKNKHKPFTPEEIEETLSKLKGNYITLVDANYPEFLKNTNRPPMAIFLNQEDADQFDKEPSPFNNQFILNMMTLFEKTTESCECGYCGNPTDSGDKNVLCPDCRKTFGHTFLSEL